MTQQRAFMETLPAPQKGTRKPGNTDLKRFPECFEWLRGRDLNPRPSGYELNPHVLTFRYFRKPFPLSFPLCVESAHTTRLSVAQLGQHVAF